MNQKGSVLLLDRDISWQDTLKKVLTLQGYHVEVAGSYTEASHMLDGNTFNVAVVNFRLASTDELNNDGMKVVARIHKTEKSTSIIIVSEHITAELTMKAMREYGVSEVMAKSSLNIEKLIRVVEQSTLRDINRFRYYLQEAIDLYAKAQERNFSDTLDEINDQLGYGQRSMTIQKWLLGSTFPIYDEVAYFVDTIKARANLDLELANKLFNTAGYRIPDDFIVQKPVQTEHIKPMERPADIFISYARTDIDVVQKVYRTLLNKDYHPWMDKYSTKGGENWLRAIYKAIDECEIFLAILSNNSVSRRGVIQKELKKALDKWEEMLPDDIYMIPIRIDDCPIPDLVKHFQVLDWENGKGKDKLLEAIRVGLSRRHGS